MFQVLYRLEGAGTWSPWFLPGSVQAANGQVRVLQKHDETIEVLVTPSGETLRTVDVKV